MANGLIGVELAASLPQPETAGERTDRQLLERFHGHRDEGAFTALVRRHGAMVLGVCKRVLENAQDAEDAFQATFLVLARRAGEISRPELLGNWLYGVANRIARKARAQTARRRIQERQAAAMGLTQPSLDHTWNEVRSVLDQELERLPEKYRAPLVLCYLEGLTNQEAARRLGWPSGSMSARLSRGRELLRRRLEGRQSLLPAGFLVPLLVLKCPVSLPGSLIHATVQAAVYVAEGKKDRLSASIQNLLNDDKDCRRRRRKLMDLAVLVLLGILVFFFALVYTAWSSTAKGTTPGAADGKAAGAAQGCH